MATAIEEEIRRLASASKKAAAELSVTTTKGRNDALRIMAEALRDNASEIIAANEKDMRLAREAGQTEAILDRLMLDESRVYAMAGALEDLALLEDPLGEVLESRELYNGIELTRVSVPLGVVAVVFEARPNVCADAAGICIKSGNACILRGGSLALNSNVAIADALSKAAEKAGLPANCITNIATSDRSATDALMQLHGVVDVLIPRGGAGLISHCVENSKVPVIETGTGNCHVYVHESADLDKAAKIAINSKCRRYGVCNACETLLVDESISDSFLPKVLPAFFENDVVCHVDERASRVAKRLAENDPTIEARGLVADAVDADWDTEYLAPEIAIKCVEGPEEAIRHINEHGTHHSDSIVSQDSDVCDTFTKRVDSAAVYANASTAFTDGGEFGLGAEIGISTQKLHVRGPFALKALTSTKYVLKGDGQIRD